MFSSRKFVFFKKFYIIFFILFTVSYCLYNTKVLANNYAKCHSVIEINGLASDDYINNKKQTFSIGYSTTSTTDTVSSLNNTYKNFIQTPSDVNSNNNFLFLILTKKDVRSDLTCGFSKDNDVILCNSSQLWGSGCVEEYEEDVIINGVTTSKKTSITTCELFNQQNIKEENSVCYPQNHICNTYKNNVTNKYFSVKGSKMSNATNTEKNGFYIYTKNVVGKVDGSREKTCEFEILPCDLKLKNEATASGFINVVFKNTNNKYNKQFIENISSGYNESDMFFKYVGKVNINSTNYNTIMKAPYYYKYVNANSESEINSNTVVYYYKKYLTGGTDPKGRICSGYLPNCKYVDPNEESNLALYNRVGDGNTNNRNSFYNGKVSGISDKVKEEYLWFASNPYSVGQVCLSRTGTSSNVNHDIGYCSDLKDDLSGLKYDRGLEYNADGTPKCYLKSCIDLTVEELSAINNKDGSAQYKWCSEYYYLESSSGLKYFPKEKPKYCSDLDSDGYLEYRAIWESDGGKYRYCLEDENNQDVVSACKSKISGGCDNLTENSDSNLIKQCSDCSCRVFAYYSYGGGRNSTKSNCYLKNCFSLNDKERQVVADANVTNVGFEMERNSADLSKFSRDNLPKYCDNGFLFNNKMDEFKDFDYLNLNVISCLDFSNEQLNVLNNNTGRIILFTDLLSDYDSTKSNVFCRTHYKPLNKSELLEAGSHNEKTNFLETTYIIADESGMVLGESPYKTLLDAKYGNNGYNNNLGVDPFIDIPERAKTDYKKVNISDVKKAGTNKYLFLNVCSYVDNSFLYYNGDIWDLRYDIINSDSNAKVAEVINTIQNNNATAKAYLDCKNEDCTIGDGGLISCKSKNYDISDTNMDNDCKKCNKQITQLEKDKCLYEAGDKCKYYAYDYMCKRDNGCYNEDGITIKESTCFLKNNIMDYTIDCNQYISTSNITSVFDCSLFSNTSDAYKDIYNGYLSYKSNGLIQNDLEEIKKECSNTLPLSDTRTLPEPDLNSALLKPFKLENLTTFNNNTLSAVSKNDFERYGCAVYDTPTNVTDVLGAQLWGCKVPDIDSSYISKYTSDFIINNVSFKEEFKQPYLSQMMMSVCSRYPGNKYTDNNCGQREGSFYKDKCLGIIVDNENISNSETLEDTTSGSWYFKSGSGGSRFRYEKHGRDILVFRDFYTYYKCNASNIDNKYYYDEKSAGLITAEAIGLGTIIGAITGAIGCAFLLFTPFSAWWYPGCIAGVTAIAVATSITTMMLARTEEYNLSLQNNLYYPHEYFGNEEQYGERGFLSKANITNNDNYIYRYYQRADTIEEDLQNKLESNINWDENNTRFFFGNTLSKDIIRKCNIQNLFGLTGDCVGVKYESDISDYEEQITYNQTIHCDYKYSFFVLEDDGSRKQENGKDQVCIVGSDENAKKCLTYRQIQCLDGYGVKFLFNKNINNKFLTSDGYFLKTYQEGAGIDVRWDTLSGGFDWVPVNIVPYTMDISSKSTLGGRDACKLMKYGDSFGSLDKCRGFEHEGIFYTESQSVKTPLFTSPVFFYGLITPRNVPELFNPTVVLDYYYLFSRYYNGEIKDSDKSKYEGVVDNLVLDFYNPKVQYYYDFANGTFDDDYYNKYTDNNKFIVDIQPHEKTGKAHVLRYISDVLVNEMSYGFVINKSSIKSLHNSYTPQVCLYQIKPMNNIEAALNNTINTSFCNKEECKYKSQLINETTGVNDVVSCCLDKTENQSFVIVDNDVECYERAIPFLSDFVFMQSKNIDYNNPVINVYLKPSYKTIEDITKEEDKDVYILKNGGSEDILLNGENSIQSFGLNFERSYCSKAYYDYYENLDLLDKELSSENTDSSKVSLYRKSLATIEGVVIPDCNKENGNEVDLLINEDSIKTYNDVNGNIDDVVVKKTIKIRSDNAAYGGFNEICIADNDIKHILKTYNRQRKTRIALPTVLAYKSTESINNKKTKCILDIDSMKNTQCMVADKVYIYCTEEEAIFTDGKCKTKLDITNNKEVSVREVDCRAILDSINTTSSLEFIKSYIDNGGNIADIQACYKGGFNTLKTIYKSNLDQEYSCSCTSVNNNSNYDDFEEFVTKREITPREYGLCVDLVKPTICPAVRYFDSKSQYVDDRLALGKTEKELRTMDKTVYEQHVWRTQEKQLGILPSVFYEKSLGHAEFPASVYCGADKTRYKKNGDSYIEDDSGEYVEDKNGNKIKAEEYYKNNCVGGKVYVEGECNGYWKENIKSVPIATCVARTNATQGVTIYEYKLLNYGCERYSCPAIGYDASTNVKKLDEKTIESEDSQLFTEDELKTFSSGVELTNFTSFIHNEELNSDSADVRGASNGFAVWGELNINGTMDVISDDYAKIIKSESCLTGFAPAGTNRSLLTNFSNQTVTNYEDYNIFYQNTANKINNVNTYTSFEADNTNKNSLVQIYIDRKSDFNEFIDHTKTPQRRCNQFGEWMTVEDPYNNALISSIYGENYYYNSNNNFWKKIYQMSMDDDITENDIINNGLSVETVTAIKDANYCERLVCPEISSKGSNYFDSEFVYGSKRATRKEDITNTEKSKYYTFWKHSGGAFWDMIGAPRNSSNIIEKTDKGVVYGDSSRYINEIFTNTTTNDSTVYNKYKYVKKVYGRCENEYGYYNRNSKFNNTDFTSQYNVLTALPSSQINTSGEVDPRIESMLNASIGTTTPSRHCTSIGLWSGVLDPCFRACEMMDIYHTTFNKDVYDGQGRAKVNISGGEEYFINNNDIVTIDVTVDQLDINGKRAEFEDRFINLHNPEYLDIDINTQLKIGDYLTGGAKWPRSIVVINDNNIEYKMETSGSKKGLRYIEVESDCDSSYDTGDSRIRQFILSGTNKRPKRKCYEDGSWGPVYGDTRCVLAKNCVDYSLTMFHLTNLMMMYNRNMSAREINNYIANIPYGTVTHLISNNKNTGNMTTNIYNFAASNTVADGSKSYNVIKTSDSAKYLTTVKDESKLSSCDTVVSGECVSSAICTITESDDSVNMAGWSLNLKDNNGNVDTNIGRYFKPTTCVISNTSTHFYDGQTDGEYKGMSDVNDLNRIKLVYTPSGDYINRPHYSKNSLLNESYNLLNGGSPSNCDPRNANSANYTKTSVQNESCKGVNIGKEYYNSYQIHYECKDEYYNKLSGDTGNYYNKHIIFECKTRGDSEGKFYYHNSTENNENGNKEIIKASNCLPITCGQNNYQQGWSESIIKELENNGVGFSVNYDTVLTCPAGKAFVFENAPTINKTDGGWLEYYEDVNGTSYERYNFVSKIHGTCSRVKDTSNKNGEEQKINGTIVANSYDYRRYGEIKLGKLLETRLCRDIYKKDCVEIVDETEIFAKGNEFVKNYCVPMACPYSNLKFKDDDDTVVEENGGFSLPLANNEEHNYKFSDVVIIESLNGDYTGKKNGKDPTYRYVQYGNDGGTAISGNLCPKNNQDQDQDIYNAGVPADYDVYQYLNSNSVNDSVRECFNNLDNNSISKKSGDCPDGYTNIDNQVCVKYNDSYKDKIDLDNLTKLKNLLDTYKPDESELRKTVAEYIVNNIIFNGIEIRNDSNFVSQANTLINTAKIKAIATTSNYVNKIDSNNNIVENGFLYIACYYNDNLFNPNNVEKVDSSFTNDTIVNYNNIVGTDNEQFYKHDNQIGILSKNTSKGCDKTINKYIITSSSQGFYKIKYDGMCVNSTNLDDNGNYIEDGVEYVKYNASACEYSVGGTKYTATRNFNANIFGNNDTYTDIDNLIWTKTTISATSEICIDENNKNIVTNGAYEWQNTNENCLNTYSDGVVIEGKKYTTTHDFSVSVFGNNDTYTDVNNLVWTKTAVVATTEICIEDGNENTLINSGYEWKKTNENCSNKYKNGVNVINKNTVGQCFYNINEASAVSSSKLTAENSIVDCGNISSDVCNNVKSSPLNENSKFDINANANSTHKIGFDTWIPSSLQTCTPGYYFTESTVKLHGNGLIDLNSYIEYYNNEYKKEVENAKQELINQIAKNGSSSGDYKSIFEEYYKVFYLQGFLNANKENLSLYQSYDSYKHERNSSNPSLELNIIVNAITYNSLDLLDNTTIKVYAYNQSGLQCKKITGKIEDDFSNDATCINFTNKSEMQTKFNEVFKEDKDDIISNINNFTKDLEDNITSCNNVYIDYIDKKTSFDENNSKDSADYNSGLFMAMQCTPEGWRVLDKPSCKSRCSNNYMEYQKLCDDLTNYCLVVPTYATFTSKVTKGDAFKDGIKMTIDPNGKWGIGSWNTTTKITGLRYGVSAEMKYAARESNTSSRSYAANGHIKVKCKDDGVMELIELNGDAGEDGWGYWNERVFLFFYKVYVGFNSSLYCEDTNIKTFHTWTQTDSEDIRAPASNGNYCKGGVTRFKFDW